MRYILCCVLITLMGFPCYAATIQLTGYQEENGAITVAQGGNHVDPYFATKALLLARDGGMDITSAAKKWIAWALVRQNENGLFARYCRSSAGAEWKTCEKADADDALLALWIELLYAVAPDSGMPTAWLRSAHKAQTQFASLYNKERGIYHISADLQAGLLMDNVEIYAALRSIGRDMKRLGYDKDASAMLNQSRKLRDGIYKQFWDENTKLYRITTQQREEQAFYPDIVAQLFPLLYHLPAPSHEEYKAQFQAWRQTHQDTWFEHIDDDYAWGLVAVTATQLGDSNTAFCWQNKAEPFRYSKNWNVLEEAALQRVQFHLKKHPPTVSVACMEVVS